VAQVSTYCHTQRSYDHAGYKVSADQLGSETPTNQAAQKVKLFTGAETLSWRESRKGLTAAQND